MNDLYFLGDAMTKSGGYEDYFYSGCRCFLEWPELIEELLPEDACKVTIEETENGARVVRF